MRKMLIRAVTLGALTLGALGVNAPSAHAAMFTKLTLKNAWTNYSSQPAGVTNDNGIIRFRGALKLSEGNSTNAFTLPEAFRPIGGTIFHTLDMCNAHKGSLQIQSDGDAFISSNVESADLSCFVSLDGVSFAKSAAGATALTPKNGWAATDGGTRAPAAKLVNGVVNLMGNIGTHGEAQLALKLPAGMRPNNTVVLPTEICGSSTGAVLIESDGDVFMLGDVSPCGTSLEGLSFLKATQGATSISPQNDWVKYANSHRSLFAKKANGIVHLTGALRHAQPTLPAPFTLPAEFRPNSVRIVPVTLCGPTQGRAIVTPSGIVLIQTDGHDAEAACMTSFEGVTFSL